MRVVTNDKVSSIREGLRMLYTDTIIEYYEKSKPYGLEVLYGKNFTVVKIAYDMLYLSLVFGEYSPENFHQIEKFLSDLPYCWFVNKRESHVGDLLVKNGFTREGSDPVMGLDLSSYRDKRRIDTLIKEVNSVEMLDVWSNIASRSYGLPKEGFVRFALITAKEHRVDIKAFIGYMDGKPVATSMVHVGKHTAAIYWVGVLEEYRNRGIGSDMTKICIGHAKNQNKVKTICLQSFQDGISLYQKLGFNVIDEVVHYIPQRRN